MSGIPVLSVPLKGGQKVENKATSQGKETSDGYENAAAVFAAMLNGKMNLCSNTKGQSSSLANQDSEEKQGYANPVQSDPNSNSVDSILGYGNFVLPFLTQMMLQSDLPAGKEANSGESVSQGIENSLLVNAVLPNKSDEAGKNLNMALLNLVSLTSNEGIASTGMTTPDPQGDNPGITELDKYRQVITNLLVALSGKITDSTPVENLIGVNSMGTRDIGQEIAKIMQGWTNVTGNAGEETTTLVNSSVASSIGTKDFHQELAKVVQGLMTLTEDGGEESSSLVKSTVANSAGTKTFDRELRQNVLQRLLEVLSAGSGYGGNPELNTKAVNLLAALYPSLIEGAEEAKVPQGVNETLINQPKGIGIDLESIVNASKDTDFSTKVQQKPEGTGLRENEFLKIFQDFNKEVSKANFTESKEPIGTKDGQSQASSTGVGVVVANVVPVTLADGKIVAIPVWEQISTVVREQVINKQQALKELDIQLHPEDLGKIRIFLRWESGQVHLQVHPSEAATGQLLQNQLSELRQNLISQGVNCGSLQMGQGGAGHQQPQGDEANKTFHQSNTLSNEEEGLYPITNLNSVGQDGINRINITA
ncbi:Flagellar hook-length control protein FliK [Desulfosporosinus sp. I2]|uniref:flagellar hook-length control protein FliK n=1 Tax=Desulfosporosinus sp. I2 TaxID=1617025 RepID=UPI0005EEF2AE|nr:flagellar hook-length control protein FliK [Desulfosporosinus sp. I2]KJR47762.1 Flagellar hook-length control protein FliK [Desulfosporosinus sp. I2]